MDVGTGGVAKFNDLDEQDADNALSTVVRIKQKTKHNVV